MVRTHEIFLSKAIQKAWEAQTLALPNPSVGALILSGDFEVLALESHDRFGSSHAELLALKNAFLKLVPSASAQELNTLSPWELWEFLAQNHRGVFEGCSVYITLEPCLHEGKTPSCAKLLSILKPKRVIFGAKDPTNQAGGGSRFLSSCGIEVVEEVCLEESLNLLYPFLTYLKKRRFNLFKLAQRLNGNYRGGQISNIDSKIFTHTQRSNADSIVISGNTIRVDHPKLDTRFSLFQNKVPAIQILSRSHVPTECINAKNIKVCQSVDELELRHGFNIIEGGYPLFFALQDQADCFLSLIAPTFEGNNPFVLPKIDFELLYIQKLGKSRKDVALWLKLSDQN